MKTPDKKRLQESNDFIWWQRWHLSVSARIVSEEGEKSFLQERTRSSRKMALGSQAQVLFCLIGITRQSGIALGHSKMCPESWRQRLSKLSFALMFSVYSIRRLYEAGPESSGRRLKNSAAVPVWQVIPYDYIWVHSSMVPRASRSPRAPLMKKKSDTRIQNDHLLQITSICRSTRPTNVPTCCRHA